MRHHNLPIKDAYPQFVKYLQSKLGKSWVVTVAPRWEHAPHPHDFPTPIISVAWQGPLPSTWYDLTLGVAFSLDHYTQEYVCILRSRHATVARTFDDSVTTHERAECLVELADNAPVTPAKLKSAVEHMRAEREASAQLFESDMRELLRVVEASGVRIRWTPPRAWCIDANAYGSDLTYIEDMCIEDML